MQSAQPLPNSAPAVAADPTAQPIAGHWRLLVRASGFEELRALMAEVGADRALLQLSAHELLRTLGLLTHDRRLRVGGLLLVGRSEEIRRRFPYAQWQYTRMRGDTEYDKAERGYDCIAVALRRLRELVELSNPIDLGNIHRYPPLALRELLTNALVHRDLLTPGAVTLTQYGDRLELANPRNAATDIPSQNLLHQGSTPQYPTLFGALVRLRITNGANLGLTRVFHHFLAEGKEPPVFDSEGPTFKVVARSQRAVPEFVQFANRHRWLTVDDLLVVRHLTTHREMTGREATDLCQRRPSEMHQLLVDLTTHKQLLEVDPFARHVRTYRLARRIHEELGKACSYAIDERPTPEKLKTRILAALAGKPLTNAEVREITLLERTQAWRLMKQLEEEGLASRLGRGRFARWQLAGASRP